VIRLVAVAVLALALLLVGGPGLAAAASPDATPGPGGGGDPRSVGEGPGLVGDPLFALVAVVSIGLAAAALTALYVRATGGRRTRPPGPPPSRPRG
jgi:hypothetical protein